MGNYVLAFDTSNEVIACALGKIAEESRTIDLVGESKIAAHRASNTMLLQTIDELMIAHGIDRGSLSCIAVGRGPGSFTGVRIAMATAKGIAFAGNLPLIGVSTQEAVAWGLWESGIRSRVLIVSDAMRKELYPAYFQSDAGGVIRLSADRVIKADAFAADLEMSDIVIAGDALAKYAHLFEGKGILASERLWTPSGKGLLLALESHWRNGDVNILDALANDPAMLLPIYTRLSDAEESERERLKLTEIRNLRSGVRDNPLPVPAGEISLRPMDAAHADDVASLEGLLMGSDAWNASMMLDDLNRTDRTWWIALDDTGVAGYAGALIVDGDMQILKVAVRADLQRRGIAKKLLSSVAQDALNLGASTCSLEVRRSNEAAIALYERLGLKCLGQRNRYYSDGEAALIMSGALIDLLDNASSDPMEIAGIRLDTGHFGDEKKSTDEKVIHPIIVAIESSCDETAASIIDGNGRILSDVVASQIDFHARFGGVVPEIASRKHIEAICGVCKVALEQAREHLGSSSFSMRDIDAVAATYAPGLVGALVVGVAFAKGASWVLDVPFIGVNHMEGHLYANKIGLADDEPFEPPAVVSLVSGGNTMLVHMRDWHDYEILGQTIDDAVGEAFDKVAKALGLPYPGGPHISKLAESGDETAIEFPRAMMHSGDYRFSLSGLKTAVINYINDARKSDAPLPMEDICASFQQAVVDVQVSKAEKALIETGAQTFCLGGGVAANPKLRASYEKMCDRRGVRLIMPPLSACGDNAAMIALVALDRYNDGKFFGLDADAHAHADLSESY